MMASELSFHESTVVAFDRQHDVVRLSLSDVRYNERTRSVYVEVRDVTAILADGRIVTDVRMEHEDGEVLTLEVSDEQVYLIVQWNDFGNHATTTKSYRVNGHVSVRLSPGV